MPSMSEDKTCLLEAVADLVGPEALEAGQRLVETREIVVGDAADRVDRLAVLVVQRLDDLVHRPALLAQADAHRAPVDPRAGMMEIAHLDELLDVVGDVRAEVVAAGAQLARGQLLVADVVEQQRLDAVDVVAAAAL